MHLVQAIFFGSNNIFNGIFALTDEPIFVSESLQLTISSNSLSLPWNFSQAGCTIFAVSPSQYKHRTCYVFDVKNCNDKSNSQNNWSEVMDTFSSIVVLEGCWYEWTFHLSICDYLHLYLFCIRQYGIHIFSYH
jgi:hypothetical protein